MISKRDQMVNHAIYGVSTDITEPIHSKLSDQVHSTLRELDKLKDNAGMNKVIRTIYNKNGGSKNSNDKDEQIYTDLAKLLNSDTSNIKEFSSMLDEVVDKNKKYFTILKDYEMMPILIPQINRVLMFLVNECISPDIQNSKTFNIKVLNNTKNNATINKEIQTIRDELKLDKLLPKVYDNRFKFGREYYQVVDYSKTFDRFRELLLTRPLNEDSSSLSDMEYLHSLYKGLKTDNLMMNESIDISETKKPELISLADMNIEFVFGPIMEHLEELQYEMLEESTATFSMNRLLSSGNINKEKAISVSEYLSKKSDRECSLKRLDPAKIFKLAPGRKEIGYIYVENANDNRVDNRIYQIMRDRLYKQKKLNITDDEHQVEKKLIDSIAKQIINKFDPNIGINRLEDIDLLHDFIHNNLLEGNKRITFYYKDDIVDLSRDGESILTNAVLFTKLYSQLMLHNISTKILRGKGRHFHRVNMGASHSHRRYIENAIHSLTNPDNKTATLTGSFENLLNGYYAASDIMLPVNDMSEPIIATDIIDGVDVDMDMDILRFLLNSIIMSFGLDSAVIDTTNGNIDFAKTLSMLSLQIANLVKGEQNDLIVEWKQLVLSALEIKGSDELKSLINNNEVEVSFYSPKSLVLAMSIEEINNVSSYANSIADVIPDFQLGDENADLLRSLFVYNIIRRDCNLDWESVDDILNNLGVDIASVELQKQIKEAIVKYKEAIKEEVVEDPDGDGMTTDEEEHVEDFVNDNETGIDDGDDEDDIDL